jgi:hypothetical protein
MIEVFKKARGSLLLWNSLGDMREGWCADDTKKNIAATERALQQTDGHPKVFELLTQQAKAYIDIGMTNDAMRIMAPAHQMFPNRLETEAMDTSVGQHIVKGGNNGDIARFSRNLTNMRPKENAQDTLQEMLLAAQQHDQPNQPDAINIIEQQIKILATQGNPARARRTLVASVQKFAAS